MFGVVSCWNTALRPSLRREGVLLCFSMSQYMLALMVPSMNCSSPVPAALIQPQTITLPPPCLTVGKTHMSLYSSPGCRHTRLTPSEPKKFILVSSDHMVPVIHVLSLPVFSKLKRSKLMSCLHCISHTHTHTHTHAHTHTHTHTFSHKHRSRVGHTQTFSNKPFSSCAILSIK